MAHKTHQLANLYMYVDVMGLGSWSGTLNLASSLLLDPEKLVLQRRQEPRVAVFENVALAKTARKIIEG
jgi:hypothetical protein